MRNNEMLQNCTLCIFTLHIAYCTLHITLFTFVFGYCILQIRNNKMVSPSGLFQLPLLSLTKWQCFARIIYKVQCTKWNIQSENAQSAILHHLVISAPNVRPPEPRCRTIISGRMTRRGNSNYTLTVWRRWLKQTGWNSNIRSQFGGGDWKRQEGDLFIIWPPSILVTHC